MRAYSIEEAMANINGTSGNDNGIDFPIIYGTVASDFILAKNGNVIAYAKAGNDSIDGGEGNDRLYG